jgi:hypothetical protein
MRIRIAVILLMLLIVCALAWMAMAQTVVMAPGSQIPGAPLPR